MCNAMTSYCPACFHADKIKPSIFVTESLSWGGVKMVRFEVVGRTPSLTHFDARNNNTSQNIVGYFIEPTSIRENLLAVW
jgi:hypothetical protein